jgi:hypothetical protein
LTAQTLLVLAGIIEASHRPGAEGFVLGCFVVWVVVVLEAMG